MEAIVENAVEMNVESIRMVLNGPLALFQGAVPLELPPSRKVRALLAYLALSPRAVARSTLCELLWEVPNDPRGELLDGIDVDRSPAFQAWLTAQRRAYRERRLKELEQRAHADDMAALEQWLQAAPFDRRAHEKLLTVLARKGWIEEGKAHVAAACKRFVEEGMDGSFLRDAWRAAKGTRYNDFGMA